MAQAFFMIPLLKVTRSRLVIFSAMILAITGCRAEGRAHSSDAVSLAAELGPDWVTLTRSNSLHTLLDTSRIQIIDERRRLWIGIQDLDPPFRRLETLQGGELYGTHRA